MIAFKTALITGASSGIGAALALELARRGCALALSARRAAELELVAAQARALGVTARVYPCDTRDRDAVRQTARRMLDDFGVFDLAVLGAGVSGNVRVDAYDGEAVARVLETNLLGALYWVEALLPAMRERGAGTLAAVSSLAAGRGLPNAAAYCASKAGLSAFFESLRVDLKPHGVRAAVVEPGLVRTPLIAHLRRRLPFLLEPRDAARVIVNRLGRGHTIIRFPWPMAGLLRLVRALPSWAYDALASRVRY